MSDAHSSDADAAFARRLTLLAPSIDRAASRELFDRRRADDGTAGGGPRQWLAAAAVALLVGGIVGLWALSRGGATAPATDAEDPVDRPSDEPAAVEWQIVDGVVEPGEGFEVHYVAESHEPYGQAWLVRDLDDSAYDALMRPHPDVPEPDLGRSIVLVTIQPDNACPDALVRFEVEPNREGVPVWTPVFEEQARECNDPLLSWLYVITIDVDALGDAAIIRLPADEVFDVEERLLPYTAITDDPGAADDEPAVVVEPTGVTVPKPPVGRPAIHNTGIGLVWVVSHDDGTVSVIPATIDAPESDDEGGTTNLSAIVTASASGRSFTGGHFGWDAWGRATNGGRANDLVGYEGRIDGDEVEILTSTARRVPGDVVPPPDAETYDLPDLGRPIDIPTFYTLSSSGPIWRYLDATLVVEDGVGRICEVDTVVPVDRLTTCADAEFVIETAVRSTQPDITTWYAAPILAFQDPVRQFTEVIPLGGRMSLNTAAFEGPPETTLPGGGAG